MNSIWKFILNRINLKKKLKRSDDAIKITDLNDDCLIEIIQYLNLVDLSNVAVTNKRLNKMARLVFLYKHSQHHIQVNQFSITSWANKRTITYKSYSNIKPNIKEFLHNFGAMITQLVIHFDDDFIIKNNSNKLNWTSIRNQNLHFPCVTNLTIFLENLNLDGLEIFLSCFPTLNDFELFDSHDHRSIQLYQFQSRINSTIFQNLRYLKYTDNSQDVEIPSILSNDEDVPLVLIWLLNNVKMCAPNLESLELHLHGGQLPTAFPLRLKRLVIYSYWKPLIPINFLFEHLEEFEIGQRTMSNIWILSILQNLPAIKRLIIHELAYRPSINDKQFIQFAALKHLEEITLKHDEPLRADTSITANGIRNFIFACKSLRRLTLIYYSKFARKRNEFLLIDLGSEWKICRQNGAMIIDKQI